MLNKYYGADYSSASIAITLIEDPKFAIHMAALRLAHLRATFPISNEQAFIMYAFSEADYSTLVQTDWNGAAARGRNERWETLRDQVVEESGYYYGPGLNEPIGAWASFVVPGATAPQQYLQL